MGKVELKFEVDAELVAEIQQGGGGSCSGRQSRP